MLPIFSKRHILERRSRPLAEKQVAPVGVNAFHDAILLEIVAVNATVKRRPSATAVEHRETYDCIQILRIPAAQRLYGGNKCNKEYSWR